MPEVIFAGPEGRLEGRYHPATGAAAPLALVLHAHPKGGGTMEDGPVNIMYDLFRERGFSVLKFNFRGVGRSQGVFDQGIGELSDAASALDWIQSFNNNAPFCWVGGYSFGAWIGMQLLMRRPEVRGFLSVAPPMNLYDFSFLAPCPAAGLILHGDADQVVPADEIERATSKIRTQKNVELTRQIIPGANHFFTENLEDVENHCGRYLDMRLPKIRAELTR